MTTMARITSLEASRGRRTSFYEFCDNLTFNFNKKLISTVSDYLEDDAFKDLLIKVVDNKGIIKSSCAINLSELFSVIDKIKPVIGVKYDLNNLVDTGETLFESRNLLSSIKSNRLTSMNNMEYSIRRGSWFMKPINDKFTHDLNSNTKQYPVMVSTNKVTEELVVSKYDVKKVDGDYIIMENGDKILWIRY